MEFGFGIKSEIFETLNRFKEDVEKMGWKLATGFGDFVESWWLDNPVIWFDKGWNDDTNLAFHLSNPTREDSIIYDIDTPEGYLVALKHCEEVIDFWGDIQYRISLI